MKVVRWIPYSADIENMQEAIGGMGGWFNGYCSETGWQRTWEKSDRWKDYLEQLGNLARPYAEALREEILRLNLREAGDWHQRSAAGVPMFEDGKIGCFSFRAWGDLLAAVWTEADQVPYSYMDFYYIDATTKDQAVKRFNAESAARN
jgi:hypothetical protein